MNVCTTLVVVTATFHLFNHRHNLANKRNTDNRKTHKTDFDFVASCVFLSTTLAIGTLRCDYLVRFAYHHLLSRCSL